MIDFTQFVPPSSPNWYLVAPVGMTTQASATAPSYQMGRNQLQSEIVSIIQATPRTRLKYHDAGAHQYHFVVLSKWFRFPDDIYLQTFQLDSDHVTFLLYSKSRYGYYDFGVNKARVTNWLMALEHHINITD